MAIGRESGGRKAGTPNHATQEIKVLAGVSAGEAVERLAELMRYAENETRRLAAIRELLDRGFGRPTLYADVKTDGEPAPHDYREPTDEELTEIILSAKSDRANGKNHA
ncbi:hypothetical protein [Paraburkholderia flagellata]|uniref:hypothetical protein n=1 Tax=Paraburkholderia flagellata TaxID=2883241 RepID=UPI001F42683E|nr:hypothetical protein [Paraburkholderia flagellata]